MSHNIEHRTYNEKINKEKVQSELDEYVSHITWQEGGHGCNPIRWNGEVICKNRDEAEKWIEAHDKKWYDCLAVRFYEPVKERNNKKLAELDKKIEETFKACRQKASADYIATRTSAYIGCDQCGSKLNRSYLRSNCCPVCRGDLRPESMLKAIQNAELKWKKAVQAKKDYVETHGKKEIKWLVKIEYHT